MIPYPQCVEGISGGSDVLIWRYKNDQCSLRANIKGSPDTLYFHAVDWEIKDDVLYIYPANSPNLKGVARNMGTFAHYVIKGGICMIGRKDGLHFYPESSDECKALGPDMGLGTISK